MKRIIQQLMLSLIIVGIAMTTASSIFAADYTFTTIDVPGNRITYANGINGSGSVVGAYALEAAAFPHEDGFFRDAQGNFTTFAVPGAIFITYASGINDTGKLWVTSEQ